jgi:hypothetical protein
MKKQGPALATVLQQLAAYRTAEGFIAQQTVSDFTAIGATGDRVRACVLHGNDEFAKADTAIKSAATADPTRIP